MEKAMKVLLAIFSEFGDKETEVSNSSKPGDKGKADSKNSWQTIICREKGGDLWFFLFFSEDHLSFEILDGEKKPEGGEKSSDGSCFKIAFFLTGPEGEKKLYAHNRLLGYPPIDGQGNLTKEILLFTKIQNRFVELWGE